MSVSIEELKSLLLGSDIAVFAIIDHGKASEIYVDVRFTAQGWHGYVPFFYRRASLFIESAEELAAYLKKIEPKFKKTEIAKWVKSEKAIWKSGMQRREVTKPFFDELVKMTWTKDFPANNNPQRRIQDIKELGYTIATKRVGKHTYRLLLPLPRNAETGYETFSTAFKQRAVSALHQINVYELGSTSSKALIPDHKFPEIRWDAETKVENLDTMPEKEVREKYQLLDNQRNQQKREVCRKCFQTGKRGVLFGIKYFYKGGEHWPVGVPRVGKAAEAGCVGCGWYDIAEWRKSLNDLLQGKAVKKPT